MSEAANPGIVDPIALEEADRAILEVDYYEWTDPLAINAAGAVEWDVPFGENWTFATIALETTQGTEYIVKTGPDGAALYQDGARKGKVLCLEPADDEPAPSDEVWHCEKCNYGPTTKRGVKIHSSRSHEADHEVCHMSEARPVLEEEATDDDAGDAGVDVQDEQNDPDEITVESVDEPDDTDAEIPLPEGVTVSDVEAAVDEHETLGDVGEAIGVTRGRARTITVSLDCYGDVKDLPAGGR